MRFDFYDREGLGGEDIDDLWNQGVCMEDWDYVLFFEAKYKSEFPEGFDDISIEPSNYNISRLLSGSSSNKWYPVDKFKGKKGIVGVAYHT